MPVDVYSFSLNVRSFHSSVDNEVKYIESTVSFFYFPCGIYCILSHNNSNNYSNDFTCAGTYVALNIQLNEERMEELDYFMYLGVELSLDKRLKARTV